MEKIGEEQEKQPVTDRKKAAARSGGGARRSWRESSARECIRLVAAVL
jgi:hypothetical protein